MSWYGKSQPCHCSLLPLLLSLSVVFLLALFSLFSGHHSRHPLQATEFSDVNKTMMNGDRRRVGEVEGQGQNSTMVLAKRRTHRKDPTDDFKLYNGGWNITDRHYWASATYSGLPFFAIAAIWFVLFGLTLFYVCLCYCCCRKRHSGYSPTCYSVSLILFSLFTAASIGGCVFLYFGQGKFHSSTRNTLDYVLFQGNAISKNLTTVSSFLDSAKKIDVFDQTLPQDLLTTIAEIQRTADSAANTITQQTRHNYKRIKKTVNLVRVLLIGIASIMLLLVVLGFGLSLCGTNFLLYTMVLLGWILVTATFILSGFFLVLHNVVGDTCVAMNEWVTNPTANTTLDEILPCVDEDVAHNILQQSKTVNLKLVFLIDNVISNVSNKDFPSGTPNPAYYKQSGPLVPVLCNPYNPDLSDRICSPKEVDFSNAAEEWKKYVCKVGGDDTTCITTGRLNPTYYEQVTSAENVSYGLYTYTPFLVQLADCTFVRSTFRDVTKIYCPGLRKYTLWIYSGLAIVSFAVMFSLIFWGIYSRERRHRVYSKELSKGSARGRLSLKK